MFNATLVGRLGRDPDTYTTTKGTGTRLNVATDHGWGENKTTTWVSVSLFPGKQAEWCAANLRKGDTVACAGDVYAREWANKEGVKQTSVSMDARDVQRLGARNEESAAKPSGRGGQPNKGSTYDDDPVPF